jgi:deoxyribodipyrimidine photolyase-like uncharacterized protein
MDGRLTNLKSVEEIADELLNDGEVFWIKELNTFYLDNEKGMGILTRGGDGTGVSWMHDIERRKKQSESRERRKGTFYGRHHTEETKRYVAEFMSKRNRRARS